MDTQYIYTHVTVHAYIYLIASGSEERKPATEDVCDLQKTLYVEEEMGKVLG